MFSLNLVVKMSAQRFTVLSVSLTKDVGHAIFIDLLVLFFFHMHHSDELQLTQQGSSVLQSLPLTEQKQLIRLSPCNSQRKPDPFMRIHTPMNHPHKIIFSNETLRAFPGLGFNALRSLRELV